MSKSIFLFFDKKNPIINTKDITKEFKNIFFECIWYFKDWYRISRNPSKRIIELWIKLCEKKIFVKYEIKVKKNIPIKPITPILRFITEILKTLQNKSPKPNVEKKIK